jgi:predicted RNA-binding protein
MRCDEMGAEREGRGRLKDIDVNKLMKYAQKLILYIECK